MSLNMEDEKLPDDCLRIQCVYITISLAGRERVQSGRRHGDQIVQDHLRGQLVDGQDLPHQEIRQEHVRAILQVIMMRATAPVSTSGTQSHYWGGLPGQGDSLGREHDPQTTALGHCRPRSLQPPFALLLSRRSGRLRGHRHLQAGHAGRGRQVEGGAGRQGASRRRGAHSLLPPG